MYSPRSPKKCKNERFSEKKSSGKSFIGPVPGFAARRPILFGSELDIYFEKTSSLNKSFDQTLNWTPKFEVFTSVPIFYQQNPKKTLEPFSPRKFFCEKFLTVMQNGNLTNLQEKNAKYPKHFSSESKLFVRILFLSKN